MVKIGPSVVKLWSMLFVMKPSRCHSKPLITKMIKKKLLSGKSYALKCKTFSYEDSYISNNMIQCVGKGFFNFSIFQIILLKFAMETLFNVPWTFKSTVQWNHFLLVVTFKTIRVLQVSSLFNAPFSIMTKTKRLYIYFKSFWVEMKSWGHKLILIIRFRSYNYLWI